MLIKTKNTKKTTFPIFAFTVFLVFFIFLTNSVNAKADGLSYTLPYNVYAYKDLNSLFWQFDLQQDIINKVVAYNNQPSVDVDLDNFFMFCNQIYTYSDHTRFYVRVVSGATCTVPSGYGSIVAQALRFTQVKNGGSCSIIVDYYNNGSYVLDFGGYFNANQYFDIFGSARSVDFQNLKYTLYYPFYSSPSIVDSNDVEVMILDVGDPVPEYENLEQFLDITSTISNGIDDSLSDLQNQQGFFNNLISNLKNFFNALKGWLYSGFNNLSLNIKNFFGPFLTNFLNKVNEFYESFEDFKDKFSKISQIFTTLYNLGLVNGEFSLNEFISALLVPEVDDMVSSLNSHTIGVFVTGSVHIVTDGVSYVQTWLNTPAVKVFHIPSFTFAGKNFTGLTVDFSWYDDYKSYGDAIISIWLILNYSYFIYRFLPRFFRSAGSGFDDASSLIGDQGVDHRIPF